MLRSNDFEDLLSTLHGETCSLIDESLGDMFFFDNSPGDIAFGPIQGRHVIFEDTIVIQLSKSHSRDLLGKSNFGESDFDLSRSKRTRSKNVDGPARNFG